VVDGAGNDRMQLQPGAVGGDRGEPLGVPGRVGGGGQERDRRLEFGVAGAGVQVVEDPPPVEWLLL
jgi:hypothetical protein